MAKTQDYTKPMQDMLSSFNVDTGAFQDAFKTQAQLGEKMTKVALDAAEKSTEITAKWAKDTIARVSKLTETKEEPADYAKAMSEFASAAAEMAAEHLSAFAEVAKKVQMDTVELMLSAGKEISQDAQTAMKKAGKDMASATKKATDALK